MTELTIRLARPEEYDEVDRLILDSYSHDYGPRDASGDPMRTAAARAEHFDVWVARDASGELLGTVTTSRKGGPTMHEDAQEQELDLRLLAVSPDARRQGVAAQLMQFVSDHATAAGFAAVFFKTSPNMVSAQRLYAALGYERVPERDGLWIGGRKIFDLLTYVRPLAGELQGAAR